MATPSKQDGLRIAKALKQQLSQLPISDVILYGSVAKNKATKDSDIDIAIVTQPFARSKIKEVRAMYEQSPTLDVRVELMVLHPEDMENRYLTIAQEIKRDGIVV